jgi:fucose permease
LLPLSQDIPALIGLIVIGLGCAPIYPSVIHSTPVNFGAENSQAVVGVQMASASTGSPFMPPLFGLLAAHTTLAVYPFYLLIFALLILLGTEHLNKMSRK